MENSIDNHIPLIMTWSDCIACGDWSFFIDCESCDKLDCKEDNSFLCFFCRNCMCCQPRKPTVDITDKK